MSRETILKEYFRLVDQYHANDLIFEQNEDTDDDALFNQYWLAVTKAHMHMVDYRTKHNITRDELTEATAGVKVGSVAEAVEVGHKLLEENINESK